MGFYSRSYYKRRAEELAEERDKLQSQRNAYRDAVRFLLDAKTPHKVEFEATCNYWGKSDTNTRFRYVDGEGILHDIDRPFKAADLVCVSSSADAAVFVYAKNTGVTYWILNKSAELFVEIPEQYICHRGDKVCEIKGDFLNEQ